MRDRGPMAIADDPGRGFWSGAPRPPSAHVDQVEGAEHLRPVGDRGGADAESHREFGGGARSAGCGHQGGEDAGPHARPPRLGEHVREPLHAAGSLAAGIIVGVGFAGIGAELAGSVLVGAQVALLGLLTAALAGLTGQILQTARGATGVAVAFVAAFFLLRGAGDALGGNGYWMSPFGWVATRRRPSPA